MTPIYVAALVVMGVWGFLILRAQRRFQSLRVLMCKKYPVEAHAAGLTTPGRSPKKFFYFTGARFPLFLERSRDVELLEMRRLAVRSLHFVISFWAGGIILIAAAALVLAR